jgi:hypothetical protein
MNDGKIVYQIANIQDGAVHGIGEWVGQIFVHLLI